MTDDLHHLSGAYALDALDDEERRAFEAHLAERVIERPPRNDADVAPPHRRFETLFLDEEAREAVAGLLVEAARGVLEAHGRVLVTRVEPERGETLRAALPGAEHHERARAVVARSTNGTPPVGSVLVVSAGTADQSRHPWTASS